MIRNIIAATATTTQDHYISGAVTEPIIRGGGGVLVNVNSIWWSIPWAGRQAGRERKTSKGKRATYLLLCWLNQARRIEEEEEEEEEKTYHFPMVRAIIATIALLHWLWLFLILSILHFRVKTDGTKGLRKRADTLVLLPLLPNWNHLWPFLNLERARE